MYTKLDKIIEDVFYNSLLLYYYDIDDNEILFYPIKTNETIPFQANFYRHNNSN